MTNVIADLGNTIKRDFVQMSTVIHFDGPHRRWPFTLHRKK